ncbi:MAG: OmpA family protein [Saprospiraceae bacterium]|nr:OmpA family protein [Saprospiraceae bacterium]
MKETLSILFLLLTIVSYSQESNKKYDLVIERVSGFSSNDRIEDITVKKDMVFFAGKDGVASFNNQSSTLSKVLNKRNAVAVKVSRKNQVYSAFKNNKIYRDDEHIYTIIENNVFINDIELFKGKLWIATNNGIYAISTSSKKLTNHFKTSNSKLKSNEINFVQYFPKLENLWIGTAKGVNEVKKDGKWTKTDFSKENFKAVTVSIDGLWLLSDKELHLVYEDFGKARFQPQGLKKGLFLGSVNDLALDMKDNLFVASDILTRYNPYTDKLDKYGENIGLIASKCIALASDQSGALWLGTENAGLYRIYKDSVDINEMMITTILENPISCPGAMDGSLLVEVSGGSPPYKYAWERVRLNGQNNPKNLKSGNYKVTVEDNFGTRQTSAIRIDDPQKLGFNLIETKGISKIGKKDGQAHVEATGGTPPYTYKWDNGESGAIASKLNFGFANVTISDVNGCSIEEKVKISKPKIMPDLDIAKLSVGQTLALNKLFFAADSSAIQEESYAVLEEVFEFLNLNNGVVVEIGGHTNNIPTHEYCDRLSTNRAKSIADYLYVRGLAEDRITYKGYGKRNPIATNKSAAGRRKNQRVEIKILKLSEE